MIAIKIVDDELRTVYIGGCKSATAYLKTLDKFYDCHYFYANAKPTDISLIRRVEQPFFDADMTLYDAKPLNSPIINWKYGGCVRNALISKKYKKHLKVIDGNEMNFLTQRLILKCYSTIYEDLMFCSEHNISAITFDGEIPITDFHYSFEDVLNNFTETHLGERNVLFTNLEIENKKYHRILLLNSNGDLLKVIPNEFKIELKKSYDNVQKLIKEFDTQIKMTREMRDSLK